MKDQLANFSLRLFFLKWNYLIKVERTAVFEQIRKRDGRLVEFDSSKITAAITKAGRATGEFGEREAKKLTLKVLTLAHEIRLGPIPEVEEIQDIVERVLLDSPYYKTAKAYILYREQHAQIRNLSMRANLDLVEQYIRKEDWKIRENSNMCYSLQGLNNYISSDVTSEYWLNRIYPPEIRDAHKNGDIHIHDLSLLSVYCVGWDLKDLLKQGFKGVQGKVESAPPKHLRSALGQIVNFFYTLQGEAAGAQAISNFDTLLAPFIRHDKLDYKEVKQALQEFVFNVNIPTRVGFQCMSEDTEILTPEGWKGYKNIKVGDIIKTFNINTAQIEDQPVKRMFSKHYNGQMYRLRNDIQDQLISPGHRVVRKVHNSYVLEEIEKIPHAILVPTIDENNRKIQETQIQHIEQTAYSGVIWCPNTKNETVIARRNEKIFITGNTPFTNVTMDLNVPSILKDHPVIIGGKELDITYSEFQPEMDLLNRAFAEIMMEGDAKGRVFTFPIPTYNITKDFDWNNSNLDPIWKMTGKYGIPYYSNFINSDMSPEDTRSMCCRLRLDNRELLKRGGGLFGANPLTGSIGVVTINLPRIGYLSHTEDEFYHRLKQVILLAKESLIIKRKVLEKFTENDLYPYSKFYLREVKNGTGLFWKNHFSTIGIIGMNEAMLNFMGQCIADPKGLKFSLQVMDFIRDTISKIQEETGDIFNLEATPAEGTSYRLAMLDKKKYPDIICANEEDWKNGQDPYYTNSTQLPVNYTEDIYETLRLQDELQSKYTGGTVFHIYLGEQVEDVQTVKRLIRKISECSRIPYFTITPTFSVCPSHGYLKGKQEICSICHAETEVYSRVVGYLRPIKQWNNGKQAEFRKRLMYKVA